MKAKRDREKGCYEQRGRTPGQMWAHAGGEGGGYLGRLCK